MIEQHIGRAIRAAITRVAARARVAMPPHVQIEEGAKGVRLRGRRLVVDMADDARLRMLAEGGRR